MVVQVIVYAVLLVVVFLCLSNRRVTVFCVVSHFDQVIVMLANACVCSLFYVGASFVNLGVALDSMAFVLLILFFTLFGDASVDLISVC